MSANCSQLDPEIAVPAPAQSVPALLAELVALGRAAWKIRERERAVRAEIEALRETEDIQVRPALTQAGQRCLA
ncbi:MAG: hypothetical protein ACRDQX_08535 [Pseudonocardiaceae bacterium]